MSFSNSHLRLNNGKTSSGIVYWAKSKGVLEQ